MKGEGIRWLGFGLGFGWRGCLARNAALGRGGALILAFSHEGLTGVCAPGTRASARDTPILAFPHKGGRDPLAAIRA